jgi:hypothetical protein
MASKSNNSWKLRKMAESVGPELENDRTITRLNPDGIAISLERQWPPYDRNGALYLSKG